MLAGWGDSLTAKFEKNSDIFYQTEMVERRGEEKFVVTTGSGRRKESIELPSEAAAVLKWVKTRKRPFHGHEAAAAINGTSPEIVIEILDELDAAGLISKQHNQNSSSH